LIPPFLDFRLKLNFDLQALSGGSETVTGKDPDFSSVDALSPAAQFSFNGDVNMSPEYWRGGRELHCMLVDVV